MAGLSTWELDLRTRTLRLEPRAALLLGLPEDGRALSVEDLLGQLDAGDRDELRTVVEHALDRSRPASFRAQGRVALADGVERWLELRLADRPARDRVVGTVLDITHRRARAARAAEEGRINTILLRVANAFASDLVHERLVQTITDEGTRLSEAEFGAYFENVVRPDGGAYLLYTLSGAPREAFSSFPLPRATAIFAPTFNGEGTVRLDDVTKDPRFGKNAPYYGHPKGHLPVRSYLAVSVRSRAGKVLGGLFFGHSKVGVFTESHERLIEGLAAQAAVALDNAALYRALETSERRFRELADAMPQIVWATRPDGTTDYFNRRWYDFTGSPRGLEGDAAYLPYVHPDDRARTHERWRTAVRTTTTYEIEYRYREGSTGLHRWFLARALPIKDEQGKVVRWFGTSTDIHEQKEAIRSRDVFLSIASHELRTPLTPLSLSIQSLGLLAERAAEGGTVPAAKVGERVARATRQVEHLERLVGVLLDVSRLGEGRLVLEREEVDLTALASEVVERLRPEVEKGGGTLLFTPDGAFAAPHAPLPVVGRWNRVRLDQVLTNLVANAMKYGRGEPVEVGLSSDGVTARLVVRDQGIGVAPEDHDRIFQRFERAVSADHYGGFGLGLWISRQVVEALGGSIRVQSAAGEGAKFTVSLPLRGEASQAQTAGVR